MRIAALDLGSNSFHLLVADVHPDGTFEAVTREKEMLRLGDDVARDGRISSAAEDRAVASVRRLRQLADASGAQEVIAKAYQNPKLAGVFSGQLGVWTAFWLDTAVSLLVLAYSWWLARR